MPVLNCGLPRTDGHDALEIKVNVLVRNVCYKKTDQHPTVIQIP